MTAQGYKLSPEEMVNIIIDKAKELKEPTVTILSPVVRGRKGEYYQLLYDMLALGFGEARIDGEIKNLHEKIALSRYKAHTIEIVIDRVMIKDQTRLLKRWKALCARAKGWLRRFSERGERFKKNEETCAFRQLDLPNDNFLFRKWNRDYFPSTVLTELARLGTDSAKPICFWTRFVPDCHGKKIEAGSLVGQNQRQEYPRINGYVYS